MGSSVMQHSDTTQIGMFTGLQTTVCSILQLFTFKQLIWLRKVEL